MQLHNEYLYIAWMASMLPMLIIAIYGIIRCNIHMTDFIIMLIIAILPIINTLVVLVFGMFSFSDWFQKNYTEKQ